MQKRSIGDGVVESDMDGMARWDMGELESLEMGRHFFDLAEVLLS